MPDNELTKYQFKLDASKKIALKYIWQFAGIPYLWGGDSPMEGFDCSGLAVEFLQAAGLMDPGEDATAHDLYLKYKYKKSDIGAGCLVFWFKEGRAIHVEIMASATHTLGASGGGSKTKTIADAIKQNAYVKLRPINHRGDIYKITNPFLKET